MYGQCWAAIYDTRPTLNTQYTNMQSTNVWSMLGSHLRRSPNIEYNGQHFVFDGGSS